MQVDVQVVEVSIFQCYVGRKVDGFDDFVGVGVDVYQFDCLLVENWFQVFGVGVEYLQLVLGVYQQFLYVDEGGVGF